MFATARVTAAYGHSLATSPMTAPAPPPTAAPALASAPLAARPSPAAPTDCRTATLLPAATPPPAAAAEELIMPAAIEPAALTTTGAPTTAVTPPTIAAAFVSLKKWNMVLLFLFLYFSIFRYTNSIFTLHNYRTIKSNATSISAKKTKQRRRQHIQST